MRTTVFVLLAGLLASSAQSIANPQNEVGRARRLRQLTRAAERGDTQAILNLGTLGDKSSIPLLTPIAAQPDTGFHSAPANARMALAKMGVEAEFDRIVKELQSEDPAIQYNAVQKLEYVRGTKAIKVLIGLLSDNKWRVSQADPGPHGEPPLDKVFYEPQSFAAMQALARIVRYPPVPRSREPKEADAILWQKWWAEVGNKQTNIR
jgi:HEAT repeat protein